MKNAINNTYIGLTFIFIICSLFIYKAFYFPIHDFANYYFSAFFLKGGDFTSNIYFPHYFNLKIADLDYHNIFVSYAPNTPFLALLFVPFTLCTVTVSKLMFNILGLILFLYSLKKLFEVYKIKAHYLYIIPLVFFIPLKNNFLFGQTYLILFFLLSEGFLAYKNERFFKMSLFWGFAILLKVFPIILFGLLLFKKKYKAFIYLGLSCALLLGASLIANGSEVWEFYFTSVLPKFNNGEIAKEFALNYQSMFMLLKGIFMSNTLAFSITLLLFKLIIIVISYFFTRQETSEIKTFSFWIFLTILLSPYGSSYSNILLLFLFVFYLNHLTFDYKNIVIISLFFLIANIPIHFFAKFPLPFSFPKLVLSILLFAFLIEKSFKYIRWKLSVCFISSIVLIAILLNNWKNQNQDNYPLVESQPILTYDYTVIDGLLNYIYWNQNGKNTQSTEIRTKDIDTSQVYLKSNQVFYKNKQLTFNNDNKLKPAVINDTTLIYLSDFKRGIGFYQLRYISL
ncbi:glycosyltransferase family 87 protein [Flavivirga spongiicola]|uniref:DUF2029 domain-containing protein n=1 Tax=Flavivirga spongiicola TaxID=421621 RepID=A0ABU7XS72_9FLAO|nr:glycosyltransferase family 87 protein [Flavivirga sp. MEBiC05379]MDO5977702.1 glycosyltransferase family 87 protein [Flavivirga sp. MEBiC05379]